MRIHTLLAPAVALVLGGCLASKGDIRLLQDDLTSTRAQQAQQAQAQERARARNDSLARVQLDSAIRAIASLNDSLRVLSARFTNYQASSSESMRQLGGQLTTLQNRVGISERSIQAIAAQREAQQQAAAPAVPGDSGKSTLPGPAQLFQMGQTQYDNGAYATARSTFALILSNYPNSGDLAHAAVFVGICYEAEGNPSAADSTYQAVVKQYPTSQYAPMALYKFGSSQEYQHNYDAARTAWERVLHDYPNSTEAQLVPDRLKGLPGK